MSKSSVTTIVCLNGSSLSGKDTFFEGVQHKAVRFAFADELKQFCFDHFGVPIEKYEDPEEARKQRDVWISVGHAGRLASEGKVWVRKVAMKIRMHILKYQQRGQGVMPIVITDCGFDNEFLYLQGEFPECNLVGVHLTRPGYENPNDGREKLSSHLLSAVVVNNCATAEEFSRRADQVFDIIT